MSRLNQYGEAVTDSRGDPGSKCPACGRRGTVTRYHVFGVAEERTVCEACGTRWFFQTGVDGTTGARVKVRYRFNKYGSSEPWP